MKIIIGAMQEELETFVKDINAKKVENSLLNEFYSPENDTVIAWTGIGTVNASIGLTYLLTKYRDKKIDYIINAGTAGGVDQKLKQNDFIVVEHTFYSMVNNTAFGLKFGQLPNMPEFFNADEKLMKKVETILTQENQTRFIGNTATSDSFFATNKQVEKYIKNLSKPIKIAEMEAGSYFQTAFCFGVPIVAVKIVSDVIGKEEPNSEQFDNFLPKAAKELSNFLQKFIA